VSREDQKGRFTRRRFLEGAGLSAATTVAIDCKPPAVAESGAAEELGPKAVPVVLRINGKDAELSVEPRQTLAEVLRFDLGMTGTKVVCDRGACSACTVWIDDLPVNSCMTFVLDAVGKEVTTIEGLARKGQLHPVQREFIAHDAAQCGFCTPGMVMSCAALLHRKPSPSLDDVRGAVSGNLCRCATYPKVFAATLAASKG
jgi:aerobic-type carbon monoxide dehydrogenase small subunit (CoxS/CutS family)